MLAFLDAISYGFLGDLVHPQHETTDLHLQLSEARALAALQPVPAQPRGRLSKAPEWTSKKLSGSSGQKEATDVGFVSWDQDAYYA